MPSAYVAGSHGNGNLSGTGLLQATDEVIGVAGTGVFTQTGGTHSVTGTLYLGYPGGGGSTITTGNGTYNLSGTGQLTTAETQVGNYGTGAFTQSGGTHTVTGGTGLLLGLDGGTGSYTLSGTASLSTPSMSIGYSGASGGTGTGTFTQSGGTNAVAGTVYVSFNANSAGTYNLDGGTLTAAAVVGGALGGTNSTFNFNGGTLRPNAASAGFIGGLTAANVRNGGAVLDTNNFNITVAQVLLHSGIAGDAAADGGLTKLGAGTLTLSAANTYTGATTARAGTLALTGNRTAASGAVTVADSTTDATLNLSNGTFTMNGTFAVASGGTSTGTVNQTGGSLTLTGAQLLVGNGTATGAYNLSAGTLTGAASTSRGVILGVNSGSRGTFNLSGTGSLAMGSSDLQVGRSEAVTATGATGVFNQTGGTATIGTLGIGGNAGSGATNAGNSGTLNLTGGTFTAAAFNALAGGNNSTALITIGGTAQVTLPALPTAGRGTGAAVNLTFDGGTLTPAAASAAYLGGITNAFVTANGAKLNVPAGRDITVSQPLIDAAGQAGALTKLGTGTLTLTGANTYSGNSTVSAGTLTMAAGTLGVAGSSATFTVDGPAAAAATASLGSSATLTDNLVLVGQTATGAFTQTGGTHAVGNILYLGYPGDASTITTGNGTYNLSGTGQLTTAETQVGNFGTGAFTQSGGTHTITSDSSFGLLLGLNGGTGSYALSGTASISTPNIIAGFSGGAGAGTGTFTQSGGTATVAGTVYVSFNANTAGTYNLDGGTLTAAAVAGNQSGGTNSTFNFNGGTLRPNAASASSAPFFGGLTAANVRNGGAVLDTNGFNVTVAQVLLHSGIAGDAATDGGLTKNGLGTLTLSAASTYTGPTTITAGALRADNTTGSATGTGSVQVNNGATLGGIGSIAGPATIGSAAGSGPAALDPGDSPGRLTFSSSLTLTPTARLQTELGGTAAGTTYDQVRVGGAAALAGNLAVTLVNGFTPSVGQTFYVLDDTGTSLITGTFANAPGGLYTDPAGNRYAVNYAAHDPADASNLLPNDVSLTVVTPEPAGAALAAVLAAAGLLARRRRRHKPAAVAVVLRRLVPGLAVLALPTAARAADLFVD